MGEVEAEERTRRFLDVETSAQRLVESLGRLDQESANYASAAGYLEEAATATKSLTAAVQEVAQNTKQALDVVASVGGPELVRRLEAVEEQTRRIDTIEQQTRRLETIEGQTSRLEGVEKKLTLVLAAAVAAGLLALVATIAAFVK